MKHTIHNFSQGSPEWAEHRSRCNNASDLAAAMGASQYRSRTDLIHEVATSITPETDSATQKRFDDGHRFEALARAYAEEHILCGALYPITVSVSVDGLYRPLSASLDGATDDDEVNFEHKTLNALLSAALDQGVIPEEYHPQMEQGMYINGASRTLFMASKWDENDVLVEEKHCWYESRPELRAKIIPTWKQVEEDAAGYRPVEVIPAAVAAPVKDLPAIVVSVAGSLTVETNFTQWGRELNDFIARIPAKPSTDQEFVDCKAAVAALKKAEAQLDAEESRVLSLVPSIDDMKREKKLLRDLSSTTRLALEKLVTARDLTLKVEIMQVGKDALYANIASLNNRLGKPYMPDIPADWANAIKGKKLYSAMRGAVSDLVAAKKIESSAIADKIELNLKGFDAFCGDTDYGFLFRDMPTLVLKAPDDFAAVVTLRVSEHRATEDRRREAEREKIRAEETAKAQAAITLPLPANRSTETAIHPAAQAVQAPSGGQPQEPAVIAATPSMAAGRMHDLIDEATQDMTVEELGIVLEVAKEIRAKRPARAAA